MTVPNKALIYYLSLVADVIMIICPYKISIFINLVRFITEAGSFRKDDVVKFLVQNGISGVLVGKVEMLYNQVERQGFTMIYDWWGRFWDFGINRIISTGEK